MQHDIADRIERLDRELTRLPPREIMRDLRTIRALSHSNGLGAVAELAHALQDDLVAHGREVPVRAYLDRMREAVDLNAEAQPRFVGLALAALGAGWAFA